MSDTIRWGIAAPSAFTVNGQRVESPNKVLAMSVSCPPLALSTQPGHAGRSHRGTGCRHEVLGSPSMPGLCRVIASNGQCGMVIRGHEELYSMLR